MGLLLKMIFAITVVLCAGLIPGEKSTSPFMLSSGNIDVTKMSAPDESVIRKEMQDKISVAKENGGYIYFSDHSVPPEVSFERYRLIMELLNEYGEDKDLL